MSLEGAGSHDRTGYRHPLYARSLAELGTPVALPACGGWLVRRAIPGTTLVDAIGAYPVFACDDWSALGRDLASLADHLVSVTVVADPFADVRELDLRASFDVVFPFKRHYVIDLAAAPSIGPRHRRNVQRAARAVQVHVCGEPLAYLDEWCGLYEGLLHRHGGGTTRPLSRAAFDAQFRVPGLTVFRATEGEHTVGLHLWYASGGIGYGHLGATSARGYALQASYALYAAAIAHFRGRLSWLDLGGVAGASDADEQDGLRQFKAGWATDTRTAFLCGRVLQPGAYARLVRDVSEGCTPYFPLYRRAEAREPASMPVAARHAARS